MLVSIWAESPPGEMSISIFPMCATRFGMAIGCPRNCSKNWYSTRARSVAGSTSLEASGAAAYG